MAAEETIAACNMDLFPMETLGETGLRSGESLGAFQSCLDPCILSMFGDTSALETKGLDEESETTLLTALTEILDNVDDENPSPFDMLPDSDLLSNQKSREHSPLKRILCLSHSLQDKDTLFTTRSSSENSLFKIQTNSFQRSDGEEEEDGSFTLSPDRHSLSPDIDLFGWEGLALPLPITFEQEDEDGFSVNLGDLVRQMHPYCIPISVENEEGEHLLPEGGIVLEVVDQGENGEPILAIQNMGLADSGPLKELCLANQENVSDEAEEEPSDGSEHIVVDDEDDVLLGKSEIAATVTSVLPSDTEKQVVIRKQKKNKTRSPSQRKKKKKCKQEQPPKSVEGRVLRSGTITKPAQEMQKKPDRKSVKEEKKQKFPCVSSNPPPSLPSCKEIRPCETKMQTENTTTASLTVINENAAPLLSPNLDTVPSNAPLDKIQPECSASAERAQQPCGTPQQPITPCVEAESSPAASSLPPSLVSSESCTAAPNSDVPEITLPGDAALPVPEPKPKSLSLEEYRRLRQQKKPVPVEKQDKNSTKWPTLPELPKELTPIPCLPDPNPKDLRRPNTQVVEEVKPAWQPRGPGAPPTPEALLVPPAYMMSSSNKVASTAAVTKPQQTQDLPKPPQKPQTPYSEKNLATRPHATPSNPTVPCVPQTSASPASLKPANHFVSSEDGKRSEVSGKQDGANVLTKSQPISLKPGGQTQLCPVTATDVTKQSAASGSAPSAPQNSATISQKLPEVTASSKSSDFTASSVKPSPDGPLFKNRSPKTQPVVLETKKPTSQRTKDATQELIEAFASEIGIEAADLTSLLEQFEETQVKDKRCVSEVSGRAAAVGNSRTEPVPEKTAVERLKANLSTAAALTPPATPPHQLWKPLPTAALLAKSKAAETSSKVIQIEAQPLPSVWSRSKATAAAASVSPDLACMDHDYCLPNKGSTTEEPAKRWNVRQQSLITIKPIQASTATQTPPAAMARIQPAKSPVIPVKTPSFPQTEPLEKKTDGVDECFVLETPDASPTRQESESSFKVRSPRREPLKRSYRRHAASRSPSPRSSPKKGTSGRSRKRSHRSPSPTPSCSDSCSSRSRSRSCSPAKKRYRSRDSDSSSSCSSRSSSPSSPSPPRRRRNSYSSSRSGSWSRSRSRSPQRQPQWNENGRLYSPSYRPIYHHSTNRSMEESKMRKERAIEERRVVYVGKIRETMTHKELRERFSFFGEIEECTLHFRDHGDNYGFVTFYDTKHAFTAIENGSKLRKPDELPFDLCFGGRRQFCQSNYSDLDSSREYDSLPAKGKFNALDFDTLLKQAQQNLKR